MRFRLNWSIALERGFVSFIYLFVEVEKHRPRHNFLDARFLLIPAGSCAKPRDSLPKCTAFSFVQGKDPPSRTVMAVSFSVQEEGRVYDALSTSFYLSTSILVGANTCVCKIRSVV